MTVMPDRCDPYLLWVCTDCYLDHHGVREDDMPPDQPAWGLWEGDGTEFTAGLLWEEHESDCPNRAAEAYVAECECEHITFTYSPCHGCGSTLGGERHAVTAWIMPDGTE